MNFYKICVFVVFGICCSWAVQACESPWLGEGQYEGSLSSGVELPVATGEWLRKGAPNELEFVPLRINQVLDGENVVLDLCVGKDYMKFSKKGLYAAPGMDTIRLMEEMWDVLPPTPHLVDIIHTVSQKRMLPHPRPPSSVMTLVSEGIAHLENIGFVGGGHLLVSGHKKDIVLSERLLGSGKIAIYGWIKSNGKPIQPLNLFHHAGYGDYSHGFRPILNVAHVNGEKTTIREILADPIWHALLNPQPIVNW